MEKNAQEVWLQHIEVVFRKPTLCMWLASRRKSTKQNLVILAVQTRTTRSSIDSHIFGECIFRALRMNTNVLVWLFLYYLLSIPTGVSMRVCQKKIVINNNANDHHIWDQWRTLTNIEL